MTFALRPVSPSDIDALHRLQRRAEAHDRVPIATPRAEFEEWFDDPHCDPAADTRLVEAGGDAIAWGRVWHRPSEGSEAREARAFLFGAVDPAHRGRGVGSNVLRWQMGRAEEILGHDAAGLPRHVRAVAYDFQPSAQRLYTRHGMTPVRYADELLRDLEDLPPPAAPAGIAIVRWDPARAEAARRAQNDAFADHWGSTPLDAAAWAHLLASFQTRLDLSFMALDGERVVGVCRNGYFPEDEAVTGRREGWIMQVSTVRSHRQRGIAAALIVASLAAFRSAGLTHSALGVDSENPTGAYRLYERLGYRPVRRSVVFQRTLSPACS